MANETTEMIHLKVNGIPVEVPKGATLLDAAKAVNVEVPTLCYLKDINCIGACRVCVVEAVGRRGLLAACVYPAEEGMEVLTNTPAVRHSRKTTLELLLSNHKKKCLSCERSEICELQRLAREYGVDEDKFSGENDEQFPIDDSSAYVVRDNNKCIHCMRCVAACKDVQGVSVIGPIRRGFAKHIGSAFDMELADVPCVGCGQCIVACPVGALTEKSNTDKVWDAIADPNKKVVFFTAPSVRATVGEAFGMPVGTNAEGKMVAAIRRLGDVKVFNMDVTADLTIMEEANELIERISNGGTMPMFTSCCPGWVKFCEHYYPDFLPHLSSCKSPQQMFGAVLKSYYCEKNGIDPKDLFVVSVIPCTAKKFEVTREEQRSGDFDDVDVALTTRELARMIKNSAIKFTDLEDEKFDDPFEIATGGGAIFGATGGVMEAALRTAACILDGSSKAVDFVEVRGTKGIKEATYTVAGKEIKVAVASGLANARKVVDSIISGEKDYTFVEIMACPGGCINGGGQPYQTDSVRNYVDLKALRAKALYDYDVDSKIRMSHESPVMKVLYDEYFEAPGKEKAHHLLHTTYVKRGK
ncbi:NADH-quinone oxidoreductase subunit G [Ruminococcus sp. YE71]|uniref:NADH-dependent [FeFe] hydrogenase, group A6 n=1 Tax=unclassified Ruminococcus TaxID=2608920 RepID=UPI0008826663|nr:MULTISPECIES: NADH-dependent [FeFe] hydrogenase, group A6 [unclassified Ruminococcus]SDA15499.1 NADH-quinone oxidoreductase subunit G [Ruminococcus sp. YE78]SFW22659.1 NADH-quinone oxidoreductase subunit G [Ruminococcus sp. YE71]